MRVPAVEHLDVRQHDLRRRVRVLVGRARGRDDVDAVARQHVAGDADDLVHAHRHGAHALRNHRRQPEPASFDASLALRIGSFLTIGTIRPRPMTSSRLREGALRRLPCRELDDRDVLLLQLGAELQVGGGDDDSLRRRVHRLHRLVLHEVVGAVRQPASGENGYGEDCEDSAAHVVHLLFVPHQRGRLIVSGAPSVECRDTRRATGLRTMNWNG